MARRKSNFTKSLTHSGAAAAGGAVTGIVLGAVEDLGVIPQELTVPVLLAGTALARSQVKNPATNGALADNALAGMAGVLGMQLFATFLNGPQMFRDGQPAPFRDESNIR